MDIRINIANLEVRFDTNADETASIEYMANVHPEHVDAGIEEIADEFTNEHLGIDATKPVSYTHLTLPTKRIV